MSTDGHLKLRLFRLKQPQDWNAPQRGLFFLFFTAGAGECFYGDPASPVIQPLACGDVLVLQTRSGCMVRTALQAELAFFAFSIHIEDLFPLFMVDQISRLQTLMESLQTPRFYPATNPATVGWLQLIRNIPSEFDLEHRCLLLHVAGAILSEEFRTLRPPLSRYEHADARVARLFDQLSVEQILSLSREELAERFGCSQRHLNRLFKEHFGLPVSTLRMEMRLLKVVCLLRNPEFRIVQAAEQCGFHHLGFFNACFKRRFGLSPGRWRRNLASGQGRNPARVSRELGCRLRDLGLCPLRGVAGALDDQSGQSVASDQWSAVSNQS